jgi:hypothetical protein
MNWEKVPCKAEGPTTLKWILRRWRLEGFPDSAALLPALFDRQETILASAPWDTLWKDVSVPVAVQQELPLMYVARPPNMYFDRLGYRQWPHPYT